MMDCNKDHVVLQTGEIVERRGECGDPTCNVGKHPGCWRTVSPAIWVKCERYRKALEEILKEAEEGAGPSGRIIDIVRKALGDPWPPETRCTKETPWDKKTLPVLHVDAKFSDDSDSDIFVCPNCGYSWSLGPDV